MLQLKNKAEVALNLLRKNIIKKSELVTGFEWCEDGYCPTNEPSENVVWKPYNGEKMVKVDGHFWFRGKINVPESDDETKVRVRVISGHEAYDQSVRPQIMMFIKGQPTYVFDTRHHTADIPAGEHEVLVNYYTVSSTHEFIYFIKDVCEFQVKVEWVNKNVEALEYDMRILFELLPLHAENSFEYSEILGVLDRACIALDFRRLGSREFLESVDKARRILSDYYKKWQDEPKRETLGVIGHSHLDIAWLWRICQGYEKAQRTLSNAVLLFEKYPDYKFMFTQPALLEKVKERDPELFRKLQKYAKEGRFIVDGAMWVEPDTNLPSGESLVRQTVWGKRFIKENFGVDSKCLWLPDVFGYSAALPQILKKSGVDNFYTTKIAWNDTNKFPKSFFKWEGLDGSEIMAFLNCFMQTDIKPQNVKKAYASHNDKTHLTTAISTYGYGDGGGGPTAEMLEYYERMKNGLPGLPALRQTSPEEFFENAKKEFEKASELYRDEPKWVGELYLEFHRGTLTSIGMIKNFNRRAEYLCHNVELAGVCAKSLLDSPYPEQALDKMWHTVLVNQFHDIIPGSSIKDVYDDARVEFDEFFALGSKTLDSTLDTLLNNVKTDSKTLIYNPNPFEVTGVVKNGEEDVFVEKVPALGWAPANVTHPKTVTSENSVIENSILRVALNDKGEIVSIIDKRSSREIVETGKCANDLIFYEDRPFYYEAWETSPFYTQKFWRADSVESVEYFSNGTVGGVKVKSRFMNSTVTQEITLSHNSARIDFKTHVDWKEDHILLRAHFPTTVHTDHATFETQYGHISRPTHRNTSWDEAKFEVCAHKWADISEYGCGVSLLNDCKYGYSALGGDLSISLLKSTTSPYTEADRGEHNFTYSLLVHDGDFRRAGVIEEAALLNNPVIFKTVSGEGTLPEVFSLAKSSSPSAVIDCIKKAEDSDATVLRLYESHNSKTVTEITLGFDAQKAYICNTLEEELEELPIKNNTLSLNLSNFEIVTLKLI